MLAIISNLRREKPMATPIDNVAAMPIRQLAVVVARSMFACAFPLILFAVLGGFAAGVFVKTYQFTMKLF
jgi:hypothetical protein